MAIFQMGRKSLNYDLESRLLPEDTVFLHGNLASNRWWQPVVDELSRRSWPEGQSGHLVRAEWLGCGKSSGPERPEDLDMRSLARDINQLIESLGLSQVNLVGHSTGGLIALCAVLQKPQLFRRLVLLDSVSPAGIKFEQSMYDAFTQMSQDKAFCSQVMASTIHGVDTSDPFIQQLFDDAFSVHPMVWHGIPDSLKTINIARDLKKIAIPVLALHGEFDTLLPIEESRLIAREVQDGQFIEIKGQGHCCNVENPKLFVDLTLDFMFGKRQAAAFET